MEKRLLLAFIISAVIFAVWSALFPPPRPAPEGGEDAQVEVGEVGEAASPADVVGGAGGDVAEAVAEAVPAQPERVPVGPAVVGDAEETLGLSNDVMKVSVTTRGAAISALVLEGFRGDAGEPLDLVQEVSAAERTLPLQLMDEGGVDTRLYMAEGIEGGYLLRWSDGEGSAVEKTIRVPERGYGIDFEVRATGGMESAVLSVGTGMRNTSEVERANRFATWGDVVMLVDGEVERHRREKVKEALTVRPGVASFAGFEDTYFVSLLRPQTPLAAITVRPLQYEEAAEDGSIEVVQVLQLGVGGDDGVMTGELFAAPKEYDLLQAVGGGLEETLDFGFFHPISVLFLKALRWIYGIVGNYGLAIILLTLGIRIVLFPLMHTSTVSMRRMQKLQPKVKGIQEKYKKNKSDPQVRAKMNQEMMALYKSEGVNPMGGCLPVLVQLPILWALYTLFAHAIELRHAPFMLWIVDLSAKDPYYITPVLMTVTMWLQQKLAPQAGDPQQQRIFRLMPLIFGVMFLGFPSGLVLYWLSNNVITILQQELTLRIIGERKGSGKGRGTRGKSR